MIGSGSGDSEPHRLRSTAEGGSRPSRSRNPTMGALMGYRKTALACLLASTLIGAKPGSTPFDPQVAFTILTGSTELRVTNENGANSATLYSVRENISIDTAPRAQHEIAIGEVNSLKLLSYTSDATGVKTSSVSTLYSAGSERIGDVDFSPDGSKIAFVQGFTKLMVYDRNAPVGPGNPSLWATDPVFIGKIVWYKGGSAIAYIGPLGTGPNQGVYEIAGAGSPPTLLLQEVNVDLIDAARTDTDALVVTYNRGPGPRVGLWKAGNYLNENLANNTFSDFGTLNCNDTKLLYGAPDQKGQLIWYIRDLGTGINSLYTKTLRVRQTQFWPTCS